MKLKNSLSGILFFISISLLAQTEKEAPLNFVVEPYLQQVDDGSFHVLWETSSPGKGFVKLGIAEFNVLRPKLNQSVQEENNGIYHRVVVDGLRLNEHYFYQSITINQQGDTLAGPATPIYIPDYHQMPVSFTVVGDTQGHPLIWGRIAELMKRERPSFVINVGDLVQYGPYKDDWVDEFLKPAAGLFSFCPFYAAIGNHEMDHENYYQYVDLPGDERFYTVIKGNVLFVFVDTNRDILPGSEQYKKLEKILASSPETWKIMAHHHPVYTSDEKGFGNTWFQRQHHGDPNHMHLKHLYETYGVDVVLNGHMHLYERTWPVANEGVDSENGVTYITLGGGGGGLDQAGANRNWFSAKTRSSHHFLSVNIVGKTLHAQAIDTSGVAFDSWTIEKKAGYNRLNAPLITETKQYFIDTTTVHIQNLNQGGTLHYQSNRGKVKTTKSSSYTIFLNENTTISTFIKDKEKQSQVAEKVYTKLPVLPAKITTPKKVTAGYFEGNWIELPDFNKLNPLKTFNLDSVSLQNIQPRAQDHFAVRFTGTFNVPETDVYRFLLESFDGSKLYIDGQEIISNDGIHYEISKENFVALEKGIHSFEVQYFDYVRRETLNIWMGTQPDRMRRFNEFIIKK